MKKRIFLILDDAMTAPPAGRQWFRVVNKEDTSKPAEILIYDQIGKDWWDDSGVGAKDFADALKAIPLDREIVVGINSPGGSVWDGLAIYHQLQARKNKVVCRVDGVAISAASFIACAGRETVMPENTLMMIHEPSGICQGNPADMLKMAAALEQHGEVIAGIYADKTGKTKEQMRQMMRAETWFTGQEAKDCGLCNTVSSAIDLANTFDLSGFRRVPEALKPNSPQNSAAARGGAKENQHIMNRKDIVALLKKHGIAHPENATDAELIALLDKIPTAAANPPTPPAGTPTADHNAVIVNIQMDLKAMREERDKERKARVSAKVDALIANCQVTAGERDKAIARAVADESYLDELAARPSIQPGADPVNAAPTVMAEDPRSIDKAVCALWGKAPSDSSIATASERGRRRADIISANLGRILPVMNTNTVSADLKRTVILQQSIRAFAVRILPLTAFSVALNGSRLEGTDKVAVPYWPLDSTASHDFVAADGYDTFGNTNADAKVVTVDKRKYQGLAVTSVELARQPYLDIAMSAMLKAEKLGADVVNDVLSAITVANFGASVKGELASAFDSEDVADLKGVADQADWPSMGRSLILNSDYDVALLKDTAIKNAMAFGENGPIREGRIVRLVGFDYFPDGRVPANAQNLVGFIAFKSGLLVAFAPVGPTPEVRQLLTRYEVVVEPSSGAQLEYRAWGDPDKDTTKEVIEANYGFAKGEAAAIKRITSVAE